MSRILAFLNKIIAAGVSASLLLLAAPLNAHSAPKTVLVLGDSLSAEYGLARGSGWVALLDAKLKADHVDAAIVNASISGETTIGGRTRLPALLKQYHPAVVVIELGANDALRGLPLPAAEGNLRAIVDAAQASHAKVLLLGMRMPPNYGRAYTDRFYGMFQSVATSEKTAIVPFMLAGIAEQPAMFQADRLHPVAAAHPTILANIWPSILTLIKSR